MPVTSMVATQITVTQQRHVLLFMWVMCNRGRLLTFIYLHFWLLADCCRIGFYASESATGRSSIHPDSHISDSCERDALIEFLQIWHKCPGGLRDGLITFWWSKVKDHVTVSSCRSHSHQRCMSEMPEGSFISSGTNRIIQLSAVILV